MKPSLRNILLSKYALLVWAVVLISLSIIFNKVYTTWSAVNQELRHAERYVHSHEGDFNQFLRDTTLISRLLLRQESLAEFNDVVEKPYGIFLYQPDAYRNQELRFWSDQQALPSPESLARPDGEYFEHLPNGFYVTVKRSMATPAGALHAYAMIPIRSDYFIETDYLPRKFFFSSSAERRVVISSKETNYPVRSLSGKPLFYLGKKASGAVPYNDAFTIWLRFGAVLLLLFFVHLVAESLAWKRGSWAGIAFLVGVVLLLRISVYLFPGLLNLRQFGLFNPSIYAANAVQRSLGDFLINSVLFCWMILFAWAKLRNWQRPLDPLPPRRAQAPAVLAIVVLLASTFVLASMIRSLIADSKISFDVTDFFSLNQYTVAGFVVLAALSLSYYYFSQLLFRFIFPVFEARTMLIYFAIAVLGLLYLSTRRGQEVLFYLPVLLWTLLYTWLVNRQGAIFNRLRINIAGMLFWIFVFSVSISAIMLTENAKVEWEKRKRMADRLAEQTDPSSENLMRIAIEYLDNDFLSENFPRFRNPIQNIVLRDSILRENYSGYLNKYDTRLYVYDSSNNAINNDDPTSYEALNTIRLVQSKPTRTAGLYYYETSFDKFHYLTWREVTDAEGNKLGSFFIVSNPKKYSGDALFPELFRQFKEQDLENSPIYSNAVYINKTLVSPPGKYPFPISLTDPEVPQTEYEKRRNGDFDELWHRAGPQKVVVIARKRDTVIETITLFSYIFCAFLFLVALAQLVSFIIRTGYSWKGFSRLFQMNIRTQVHSTIIFVSIFSFVIIGVATISFFISRYNRNNSDKLSRTMKIMVNEMQKKISDHHTFDDVIKIYDSVVNYDLQKLVDEVSDIHGVDVNVYDLHGNLYVSSEANVYTKGVLSKKMDPTAYYHLSKLRQVQHAQKERIGNLSYLSIYAPVRDEEGTVYEYINIPYFTSGPELNQEISNFLVTIINLNAFIFLVAGLIALFITNRITGSFSIISEKMKEVGVGRTNEEIEWNRDDEIGELVKEYNKMVAKLGESAAALAKSEREGAWREMARQVAHEIKNPLTPMKLSLQYLQKAISNNQPNVKALTVNVVNTLVEQIDHLSKIAADFSQFANIGNTNVELFDLHDVLDSLKKLYSPNQQVQIDWKPVDEKVMVRADRTQMNRLFTNLLANAVEACNGRTFCRVELTEQKVDGVVRVSVRDNGEGISPETQKHIFMPNFTTKSSGTGLGLAMCKGIVEQAKGRIWFETEKNSGTTFHVELPLAGT
ncbi:MAG TPA: HAMP domain-containing sensor histidine kinase [Chitinophagaceae bacterium]|nr:HAMP domain-containing sensor histidine kinase [Chitinophagaceae bacterium]